jgi:hypothetical protein
MSAAVGLGALSSGRRAGVANNSLAFFPSGLVGKGLWLAGKQLGRAGQAERHQQLEYRHIGPPWKFPGPAPVVGILPGYVELGREDGISA